jgi:hypothetical protein
MTTTFRQTGVVFAPNVSAASIDPGNVQANPQNENAANSRFQQQIRAVNFAKERDIVGSVNARTALQSSAASTSFLKFGMRVRDKRKGRTRNENNYTTSSTLPLTNYLETGFDLPPYLDGLYNLMPYLKQSAVEAIPVRRR